MTTEVTFVVVRVAFVTTEVAFVAIEVTFVATIAAFVSIEVTNAMTKVTNDQTLVTFVAIELRPIAGLMFFLRRTGEIS